jgi:hypothetical protein
MSGPILIIVGKSCEIEIVLQPLVSYLGQSCKVIKTENDVLQANSAIFIDSKLYERWKNNYSTSILIVTEDIAHTVQSIPSDKIYTITYNTDKVMTRLHVLLLSNSKSSHSVMNKLGSLYMLSTKYSRIAIWKEPETSLSNIPTNCVWGIEKEVTCIIFYDIPTVDEYYKFVKQIINRSNYPNRAKSSLYVHVYLLTYNTNRYKTDTLINNINTRLSTMRNMLSLAKQQISLKDSKLVFEDRD